MSKEVWYKPIKKEKVPTAKLRASEYDKKLIDPFLESDEQACEVTIDKKGLAGYLRLRIKKRKLDDKLKVITSKGKTYLIKK